MKQSTTRIRKAFEIQLLEKNRMYGQTKSRIAMTS